MAVLEKMAAIHEKKAHDYAADSNPYSNFEKAAAFAGVTVDQVFAVLLGIKQARIEELTRSGKEPNNEAIEDSYVDLATYATLRASYRMAAPKPTQTQAQKYYAELKKAQEADAKVPFDPRRASTNLYLSEG